MRLPDLQRQFAFVSPAWHVPYTCAMGLISNVMLSAAAGSAHSVKRSGVGVTGPRQLLPWPTLLQQHVQRLILAVAAVVPVNAVLAVLSQQLAGSFRERVDGISSVPKLDTRPVLSGSAHAS